MLCPLDNKGCCDDLCRGSGCLRMDGYPMLRICDVCGETIDEAIPECSSCTCGENDYEYFGEEAN